MTADNLTKTRTERPDKASFPAILAILLLLGGIGFGVVDFESYQSHRRHVNYVEKIRQHPEILAASGYKPEFVIHINEYYAAQSVQQMFLFSALMILFLGGGGFLLNRSVKTYRRTRNLEYEEIEWRSIDKPTRKIEVLYGRIHTVAAIIYYIFSGSTSLLLLFDSIKPSGIRSGGIFVASFSLLPALAIFYLSSNGKRKSIKSYDASGITRNDGQHFLWSDFLGVIPRIGNNLFGAKGSWRTELVFTDRRVVWIIPQRLKNYAEVYGFINALPQAVLKDISQISQSTTVREQKS